MGRYQTIRYGPAAAGRIAAIIRANGDRPATCAAVQCTAAALTG